MTPQTEERRALENALERARAEVRASLAEKVRALPEQEGGWPQSWVRRAAVLALLESQPTEPTEVAPSIDVEAEDLRLDVQVVADDVRYVGGNGTSDYWRGFNDGIDQLAARLAVKGGSDGAA